MKTLIIAALAAVTMPIFAAEQQQAQEEDDPVLATTGGIVRKPGSGKGRILVLNAQTRVKDAPIREALYLFNRMMRLPIEVKGGKLDGAPGKAKVKELDASFVIFVTDRADDEDTVIVAPESRWAKVNVAALDDDDPTPDRLENRVQKEVVRAFGLLCGSGNSQQRGTVMGPVASYTGLDRIKLVHYPLDAYVRTLEYLDGMRVKPYVEMTYRSACEQGWAASPTNKYQKAIWDAVHEKPTKPLKIEFDPKKGE